MSHPKEKIDAAIRMLKAQGHTVKTQLRDDKFWFEVDRRMLVSWEEMQNLADGVYSLAELEELFRRRRAEGAGGARGGCEYVRSLRQRRPCCKLKRRFQSSGGLGLRVSKCQAKRGQPTQHVSTC